MEALVPAFMAALIAQSGDRGPWLAAVLADRYGAPRTVLIGFLVAHLLGFAIAAAVGTLLARMLIPEARLLVLGMAMLFAAGGMAWRQQPLDRLEGWRIGAGATAMLGAFILALGDRTQFLALGFAGWTAMPALAALGALAGTMIPVATAITLGEAKWRALPLRALTLAGAGVFAVVGVLILLSAWRLV